MIRKRSYSAVFCVPPRNKKSRFRLEIRILLLVAFLQSGATSNRKWVDMTLSFSKLYFYYDVSPLNKVFTALHRSTSVCILGTISNAKIGKMIYFSYL